MVIQVHINEAVVMNIVDTIVFITAIVMGFFSSFHNSCSRNSYSHACQC